MTLHMCLARDDSVLIKTVVFVVVVVVIVNLAIIMPSYKPPLCFWLSQELPRTGD